MSKAIGLLTDFGLADPYVGQLRAVFAQMAPQCPVVDISHQINPYDIGQAALFLDVSAKYFPDGSVLMAVVDPGVGTDRRIIALEYARRYYLAPDNGLLGLVLEREKGCKWAFDVTPSRKDVFSDTFHGRDIFAPIASKLVRGTPPDDLGPKVEIDSLARLPWANPQIDEETVEATVLHVDRFGNCVLNLREDFLDGVSAFLLDGKKLPMVRAYGHMEQGEAGILVGSQGYYEIAANMAPAAGKLGLTPGDIITLERA